MKIILLLVIGVVFVNCQQYYRQEYEQMPLLKIGALFYEDEYNVENAFVETVAMVNNKNDMPFKLNPVIKKLKLSDGPMTIEKYACDLTAEGVAAIFGPSSKADTDIVSLISNLTGIPNILFDAAVEQTDKQKAGHQFTLNVYPAQLILSKAYADIVKNFGWMKFAIVYDGEDDNAIFRLQDILQLKEIHDDIVRVRKFKKGDDYRILWKSVASERRVILDCPPNILVEVLNASIEFDLTGPFNYLYLTNMENPPNILEPLRNNVTFAVNVTATRLNSKFSHLDESERNTTDMPTMELLPDLIHDAVMLYYLALKNISTQYTIIPPRLQCDYLDYSGGQTWPLGRPIRNLMELIGTTTDEYFHYGYMQFDDSGQRTNFTVEVYEPLDNYGMAVWDTKGHIKQHAALTNVTKKMVYRVATRLGEPYFMEDEEAVEANVTGNARYKGYVVDLMNEVSKLMNIEYVFVPVADNDYGKYNKETKRWNGIIGEMLNNGAHMGICDLTVTQARKKVVDFSTPFMQLGISILAYKKPVEQKAWNNFLEPLDNDNWIYVLIAIFTVAFVTPVLARISEDEWESPHLCDTDPDVLENKWNIRNSFWLYTGSIMNSGCDMLPRAGVLRVFCAMWWIFVIIVNNSYTANLSAFMTNNKMESPIRSLEDLNAQSQVKFGTTEGGSTFTYFSESNETRYRLAFNRMQTDDPPAYVKRNEDGVTRVLKNNGSYMFLMETTSLEYNTQRDCRLEMVGSPFSEKNYAIAIPFGAEYRSSLNVAILTLTETGILPRLKTKWWTAHDVKCEDTSSTTAGTITLYNTRGLFYTLLMGLFIAYAIGITEFLLFVQEQAAAEGITFKEKFITEITFVMKFWIKKKPMSPSASSRRSSQKSSKSSGCSVSTKSSKLSKAAKTKNLPEGKDANGLNPIIVENSEKEKKS